MAWKGGFDERHQRNGCSRRENEVRKDIDALDDAHRGEKGEIQKTFEILRNACAAGRSPAGPGVLPVACATSGVEPHPRKRGITGREM